MNNRLPLVILFIIVFAAFLPAQILSELDEIKFEGNKNFSTSRLEDVIFSKETPWWFWKFIHKYSNYGKESVYFDSSLIPLDLGALKQFYEANGFFKADFSYQIEKDTADKSVKLIYIIHENEPAKYGSIKFAGFNFLPKGMPEKINSFIDVDSVKIYNQEKISQIITKTRIYLTDNGYMLAQFDSSRVYVDTTLNRTLVRIFFTTGNRYKISGINRNTTGPGNNYVSDALLNQITAIDSGEFYNYDKITNSQTRLFRTGLFSSVTLRAREENRNFVNLNIGGNIEKMNELSPEFLADNQNNQFNLGLGATYSRKNFLGDARKISFTTQTGIYDALHFDYPSLFRKSPLRDSLFQGYILFKTSLEQPYLFNRPIYGKLEAFYSVERLSIFDIATYGVKTQLEFEMPRYTFLNLLKPFYKLEFNEVSIVDIPIQETGYYYEADLRMNSKTNELGAEVGQITSDDIFFPTTGSNLTFTGEVGASNTKLFLSAHKNGIFLADTAIAGNTYFYKFQFLSSKYFLLSRNKSSVFAAKFKTGYIQKIYGYDELIPASITFFVGGSNSVRGWKARELQPRNKIDYVGIIGDTLRGGTFLLEGSFEYRKRFGEIFGTALFVDYGNVWNGYKEFKISDIAVAAGLGIRFYTKIAPFRLDFAFKYYDPYDKTIIIYKKFWQNLEVHFGIGEAF